MNAVMGPAIRVPGSGGLVPAEALSATASIEPDCEPSGAWLVVENNRVAKGIVEGALTIGPSEAGKGGAAVGGDRCAGDIDGARVAAAGIVVGYHNLVGVIRVSRSECLRLGNVGRGLGAGDYINVARAERQGCHQFLDKPTNRTESGSRRGRTARCLTASDHDSSRPHVLLLVDALCANRRTVKSNRN